MQTNQQTSVPYVSQFELTTKIVKNQKHFELSPATFTVLLLLSTFWNPQKQLMWPQQRKMEDITGLCLSTVKKALTELKTQGYILIVKGKSNSYSFTHKFFNIVFNTEVQTTPLTSVKNNPQQRVNFTPPLYMNKKIEQKNIIEFNQNNKKKTEEYLIKQKEELLKSKEDAITYKDEIEAIKTHIRSLMPGP